MIQVLIITQLKLDWENTPLKQHSVSAGIFANIGSSLCLYFPKSHSLFQAHLMHPIFKKLFLQTKRHSSPSLTSALLISVPHYIFLYVLSHQVHCKIFEYTNYAQWFFLIYSTKIHIFIVQFKCDHPIRMYASQQIMNWFLFLPHSSLGTNLGPQIFIFV